MIPEPAVFVVDDDVDMRALLRKLLMSVKFPVRTYDRAEAFLDDYDPKAPGCLLLDVCMPGMSGLELQDELRDRGCDIPIIMITAHGDVPMAVRTIKAGAIDLLEKPVREQVLLERIRAAIERDAQARRALAGKADIIARLASLTSREAQVLDLLAAGKANKTIAQELSLSPKTVESHRTRIMHKMQPESVVDLVRMTLTATGAT